uniref:Uncharacterized protein n=1 Tax=Picea glauca TaxID=3330 RepID=A0A101LW41_PICGL|nr:hypothetical protein ABT39_MTgene1537 [Picea glauca]
MESQSPVNSNNVSNNVSNPMVELIMVELIKDIHSLDQ